MLSLNVLSGGRDENIWIHLPLKKQSKSEWEQHRVYTHSFPVRQWTIWHYLCIFFTLLLSLKLLLSEPCTCITPSNYNFVHRSLSTSFIISQVQPTTTFFFQLISVFMGFLGVYISRGKLQRISCVSSGKQQWIWLIKVTFSWTVQSFLNMFWDKRNPFTFKTKTWKVTLARTRYVT